MYPVRIHSFELLGRLGDEAGYSRYGRISTDFCMYFSWCKVSWEIEQIAVLGPSATRPMRSGQAKPIEVRRCLSWRRIGLPVCTILKVSTAICSYPWGGLRPGACRAFDCTTACRRADRPPIAAAGKMP